MGADLARRPAVTSSFSFAAPHIRAGITQRSLWRVWPSPHALSSSLLPSTATPPSALPLMLARGAAPSVAASQASPPCLILSAQAAHSCGLHTTPSSYSPSPAGPSLIRVQGLERDTAWPELPTGVKGKDRRSYGGFFIKARGFAIEFLLACSWRYCICRKEKLHLTLRDWMHWQMSFSHSYRSTDCS